MSTLHSQASSQRSRGCAAFIALIACSVLSMFVFNTAELQAAQKSPHQETRMTINRLGSPQAMQDFDRYGNQRYNPLFDQGSWHGFLLPDTVEKRGGFNGPLVVAEEYAVFLANGTRDTRPH